LGKATIQEMTMRSIGNPISLHENQGLTLNRGSFFVSALGLREVLREENLFFNKKWMVTSKEF
jgi:hypothetical protein